MLSLAGCFVVYLHGLMVWIRFDELLLPTPQGMQRAVLYALFLLTTACLMAVVVIERTTPAALVGFSPQNDVDEAGQLDQVYQDALKQARADDSVVGAGFQLANLEPDPFAAKHAAEAVRRAKQTRSQQAAAPPTPQPVAVAKNAQSPSTSAQLSAPAPVPALAHVRVPVAAKVPVIKSDADALAAEQRATTFIDAAKDLERAGVCVKQTLLAFLCVLSIMDFSM